MIDEIIALDRSWEEAITRVDVVTLDRLSSNDMVYTHAGSLVEGKAGFIDHIANGELIFNSVEFDDVEVRLHGSCAVLTCALHKQTTDRKGVAGELHFRTTRVWVYENDRWQLLANQSTFITQD